MDGSILNNGYTRTQQVEQGKGGGGGVVWQARLLKSLQVNVQI